MIYADYCYYASVYMGTTITEVAFPRLAMRASRFLDYYTRQGAKRRGYGRIKTGLLRAGGAVSDD